MIFLLQSQLQHHCMQTMHYILYSIFSSARSDVGHRLFEDGILSASSWASSWQGRFSPQKTVVMQIGITCATTTATEFTLENQLVESVPNQKHLGLVISSDLTWDDHLKGVMSRGSQRICLLKQMSRYLPPVQLPSSTYTMYDLALSTREVRVLFGTVPLQPLLPKV